MTEFWVSRDKFYCKYCKIYLSDDVPSKTHHDSGFRHKGNYERYIKDIYKRGEREIKDKAEEAAEIARMDAAAHLAMQADGLLASTSTLPDPSSTTAITTTARKPKPAAPVSSDPYANYSTAASLGYIDPNAEAIQALNAQVELRHSEGIIGGWEKVISKPKVRKAVEEVKLEGLEGLEGDDQGEVKLEKEELDLGAGNAEAIASGERPGGNYFSVRKVDFNEREEEVYDPSKLGGIKLKRARLTLAEEEAIRLEEETKFRLLKKGLREIEKTERREAKKTKAGWNSVEVVEEPMIMFDDPVKEEEEGGVKVEGGGGNLVIGEEEKPSVVPASSGFKKRKMLGASATRKK